MRFAIDVYNEEVSVVQQLVKQHNGRILAMLKADPPTITGEDAEADHWQAPSQIVFTNKCKSVSYYTGCLMKKFGIGVYTRSKPGQRLQLVGIMHAYMRTCVHKQL